MSLIPQEWLTSTYRLWCEGDIDDKTMERIAGILGESQAWDDFSNSRISTGDFYLKLLQAVE